MLMPRAEHRMTQLSQSEIVFMSTPIECVYFTIDPGLTVANSKGIEKANADVLRTRDESARRIG